MIPVAITRALEKLVCERDLYKRLAQDRAPVRSADRKREIAARDQAVERLLFMLSIYAPHDRGTRGCVFDAIEALRPDIAKLLADGEDAGDVRRRFWPEREDLEDV